MVTKSELHTDKGKGFKGMKVFFREQRSFEDSRFKEDFDRN